MVSLFSLSDILPRVLRVHARQLELQVEALGSKIIEMRHTIERLEEALASVQPNSNQGGAATFNPSLPPVPCTFWDMEGVAGSIGSLSVCSDGAETHNKLTAPEVCYPVWCPISIDLTPTLVCIQYLLPALSPPPHSWVDWTYVVEFWRFRVGFV